MVSTKSSVNPLVIFGLQRVGSRNQFRAHSTIGHFSFKSTLSNLNYLVWNYQIAAILMTAVHAFFSRSNYLEYVLFSHLYSYGPFRRNLILILLRSWLVHMQKLQRSAKAWVYFLKLSFPKGFSRSKIQIVAIYIGHTILKNVNLGVMPMKL